MKTQVLLISAQEIIKESQIDLNISEDKIEIAIWRTQENYIKPLIGENMLRDIYSQINLNTLSSNYDYLLTEYIHPILINQTILTLMSALMFRITQAGIMKTDNATSKNVSLAEMNFYRKELEDTTDFLSQYIINYLIFNLAKFPLYATYNIPGSEKSGPQILQVGSGFYVELPLAENESYWPGDGKGSFGKGTW
jgi:hypothetical protein